jgi:cell division protein FtsL
MSSQNWQRLRPVLSVFLIILTLFSVVFLQMEERRLGYGLLKINQEARKSAERKKELEIQLARLTQPEVVERLAARQFTLKQADPKQIIVLLQFLELADSQELFE